MTFQFKILIIFDGHLTMFDHVWGRAPKMHLCLVNVGWKRSKIRLDGGRAPKVYLCLVYVGWNRSKISLDGGRAPKMHWFLIKLIDFQLDLLIFN